MELLKSSEVQPRLRGRSFDGTFLLLHRKSSFNCEMQSLKSPDASGEDNTKLMKRLRKKSFTASSTRRGSMNVEKRAVASYDGRNWRSQVGPRYSCYQTDSPKVGQWDIKTNIPKRWLKEYEKKQEELQKKRKKKLQPLERFRRAVKLVQTCNTAFRSIVRFAAEKGQHKQVTSDAALSLKSAAVHGGVDNLMFNPEIYKCHHEFLMPRWAKDITRKEPATRTPHEIHSIVQVMKQLKSFRAYSSNIQEAICKGLKYDCFSRRRVVVRKGHVAQRFYFIFSGTLCVTADDDEHSAFTKPTQNSVLKRGDYFGELAFIRGLKRAVTVVCLEKSELLSVEKEDFFSAKIDQCFNADMQKRVEFLKEHHMFSTWPEDVVKNVAEVSKLQEYYADEVLVRDSSNLQWMIFITKGQCDVLRLLDLSNCKDYIEHAVKYRMDRIQDDLPSDHSPNTDEISLSSIVQRGFPPQMESSGGESTASSEKESATYGKAKTESTRAQPGEKSAQGILHTKKSQDKSAKGRVSFCVVDLDKQERSCKQRRAYSEPGLRPYNITDDEDVDTAVDEGLIEQRADGNVGVGVYMMVDRLKRGQCFGGWSLLEQKDKCLPENTPGQTDREINALIRQLKRKKKRRERKFSLVSGGCEVIKIAKEVFFKYCDDATLDKLRKLTATYPQDSILCQTYLQQSDWRTYREEIVDNVVVRHIARLEAAKGSARSHKVRSSPVPSPLCSMKMWPPVKSKWEYFPDTGWVSGHVTQPVIEAGPSPVNTDRNTDRKCSPRPLRAPRGSSGTPRKSPVPPCGSSKTSCMSPAWSRGSSATHRVSSGTGRRSALLHPLSASSSREKLLPLVTNDLVLAQGNQRALVLTHGGGRCNDYQLQIERRIITELEEKTSDTRLQNVT